MEVYSYNYKNLEECLKKAEEELNLDQDQFFYKEIPQEKSLLKIKKTKIEILKKQDAIEYIKETLREMFKLIGIEINIESKSRDNTIQINLVPEKNSSILIGKNGRTVNSIQQIIKNAINNKTGFFLNIIIDIENYKTKKYDKLEYYIRKDAMFVKKTGKEKKLENMNSYERRLVHNICNEIKGIKTESFGEEPERYIIITKE